MHQWSDKCSFCARSEVKELVIRRCKRGKIAKKGEERNADTYVAMMRRSLGVL